MEERKIQDECYECGSYNTTRENKELNCRHCGATFEDKNE